MKIATFLLLAACLFVSPCSAQYGKKVVSYIPGTSPSVGFTNPTSALGEPQRDTSFGPVTVFNPPFASSDLTSIGEGGELTLLLSHFAVPQTGVPEIGIFANVGVIDVDWPNGQAGTTGAGDFGTFGVDSATIHVSENGSDWVGLGDITFDLPNSGYTDVAATTPSDYQQPFTGALSDFEGLDSLGALSLLGGSGGGMWLDISGTGLSQVGYIRFSLADDLDNGTTLNFDLDGVAVSHAAIGIATPEPTTAVLLLIGAFGLTTRRYV